MNDDEFEKALADQRHNGYVFLGVAAVLCLLALLTSSMVWGDLSEGMALANKLAAVVALVMTFAGVFLLVLYARHRKSKANS